MEMFEDYFNIWHVEERLASYLGLQWTETDKGLIKVYNEKYIKEVIRKFKLQYSDVSKKSILLPVGYYLEKDNSRFLTGKEITEY